MAEDPDKGAEIGRALGKAFRNARPKAQQFAEQAKPHVEKALDGAMKFAKDHEGEAKQVAQQIVKARVSGPIGLVVDAFASQVKADGTPVLGQCASCGTSNPRMAKFCNGCGTKLTPAATAERTQPPASP